MNLKDMMEAADVIKAVITKVRNHPDFIATVIKRGAPNPRTGAYLLTMSSDGWEDRAWLYSDLQAEVDAVPALLETLVFPMSNEENLMVSLDAIRILKAHGVTVVVDIDTDSPRPFVALGVFDVSKTRLSF
jgi:hypothetical protein